jgi:DNA-binding MarR family transcriptional regulator
MPPRSTVARTPSAPAVDNASLGLLKDVLGFRLRRIQNHLSKTFTERLAGREIKPGEFSALALIAANPGISQTELATEGGFDKTALVVLIDDLERWGWAERKRSTADRRRHALYITPVGEVQLQELFAIGKANEAPITEALSEAELRNLFATLDRIYQLCFSDDAG